MGVLLVSAMTESMTCSYYDDCIEDSIFKKLRFFYFSSFTHLKRLLQAYGNLVVNPTGSIE